MAKQVVKPTPTKAPPKVVHHSSPPEERTNGRQKEAKTPAVVERRHVKAPENIDPALFNRMKSDPGGGLSKDQSDNLVPLIYLLQPLSPQVMKGDPARIDGAEAGDIWLRNAEDPIVKGEVGMVFQPCHFWKDIVEWIPDRGGFVGRHDISCLPNVSQNKGWTGTLTDVQEIEDDEDPNAWPKYIRKSNNNEVVETRYFAGNVYFDDGRPPLPFIIPLASTGHSFGKQWMFLQNSQTLPDGSPNDKSWVFLYRLKTIMKTNIKGSWYMYTVQRERMVETLEEYERGLALNQAFATGEKKIDDEMMDQTVGTTSGSLNNDEM
jgi:hypothetical protein